MTDIGRYRSENQDAFALVPLSEDALLAVVCDGMGGAAGGKLAAELAIERFTSLVCERVRPCLSQFFRNSEDFSDPTDETDENLAIIEAIMKEGLAGANDAVYHHAKDSMEYVGMGTTLVALLLIGSRAYVCNVGDSRLYHLTSRVMKQVTRDHSYVQMLIDTGLLAPHQAAAHPDRNVITRAIGTQPIVTGETFFLILKPEESLLLCSDGLSGYLSNEEIYTRVWGSRAVFETPNEEKVKALIDAANENGGRDNITAVLVTY